MRRTVSRLVIGWLAWALGVVVLTLGLTSAEVFALTFTTIDAPPGATFTAAFGINTRGQIVGDYVDAAGGHGFLLHKGTFTTIDVPGAALTAAFGSNDRGQIVGEFDSGTVHGFLARK